MSDTVDLTLLSGRMTGLEREMRLIRLQVDQMASTMPFRLSAMEQSFHELVGETSRGFGQVQQQLTRLETRVETFGAMLASIRTELVENSAQILQQLKAIRGV